MVFSAPSQSRAWLILFWGGGSIWNRVAISCRLKSFIQFRCSGRHLESAVGNVGWATSTSSYSGRSWSKMWGSHWNYVCRPMSLETEVTTTRRKTHIFQRRVPLVFQVAQGTGKSYVQTENAKTSGIGPSRNRI